MHIFFLYGKIQGHTSDFMSDALLLDSAALLSIMRFKKLWFIDEKVQFLLPYHQHLLLMLWASIIK